VPFFTNRKVKRHAGRIAARRRARAFQAYSGFIPMGTGTRFAK